MPRIYRARFYALLESIFLVFAFMTPLPAQSQVSLRDFLGTVAEAKSPAEIARVIKAKLPADRPSAESILLTSLGDVAQSFDLKGLQATLKAVVAAAILRGTDQQAIENVLSGVKAADIDALFSETGYPPQNDQIRYLLARGPTFSDVVLDGEYVATRLRPDREHVYLMEAVTATFMDLMAAATHNRNFLLKDDIVKDVPGELAQTRRLQLSAVGPAIFCAKLSSLLGHFSDPTDKAIIRAILLRAFRGLAAGDEEASYALWLLSTRTSTEITKAADHDSKVKTLLSPILSIQADSEFRHGRFDLAFATYGRLTQTTDDTSAQRSAQLGRLVTLLALGRVTDACGQLAAYNSAPAMPAPPDASAIFLLFGSLGAEDRGKCPPELLAGLPPQQMALGSAAELPIALRAGQLANSMGRPDIGVRLMLKQVRASVRSRPDVSRKVEAVYLRELAAFLRDLFYNISYEMTEKGAWQPRSAVGYDVRRDFLHHQHPDGTLTMPGEVVILSTGTPYGMLNPESDLSTFVAAYGLPDAAPLPVPFGDLVKDLKRRGQLDGVEGLKSWVMACLNDKNPSIVPYLKLVHLEWFLTSFEKLKEETFDPYVFSYRPLSASGITSETEVSRLLERKGIALEQIGSISLVLEARRALSDLYPTK